MEQKPIILLTTDGSPDSLEALPPTVALARSLGGRILLLTVVADRPPLADPSSPFEPTPWVLDRRVEAEMEVSRQRLAEIAGQIGSDVAVEPAVLRGESVDAVIASLAAVRNVRFIAMASHGRKGLRRLLLGSVTESVVRRSSVPVIVFPVAA